MNAEEWGHNYIFSKEKPEFDYDQALEFLSNKPEKMEGILEKELEPLLMKAVNHVTTKNITGYLVNRLEQVTGELVSVANAEANPESAEKGMDLLREFNELCQKILSLD